VVDPGFAKAGWTMASANLYPAVPAGRSDPLVGVTGAPLKLKASCSFYAKEG